MIFRNYFNYLSLYGHASYYKYKQHKVMLNNSLVTNHQIFEDEKRKKEKKFSRKLSCKTIF